MLSFYPKTLHIRVVPSKAILLFDCQILDEAVVAGTEGADFTADFQHGNGLAE